MLYQSVWTVISRSGSHNLTLIAKIEFQGKFENTKATSKSSKIGEKESMVYYPPGYYENPAPNYDVTYLIDQGTFLGFDHILKPR